LDAGEWPVVETLADVGERRAIASVQGILAARGREAAKGDDGAVVRVPRAPGARLVVTTDTLTYALHRFPGAPLRLFGYYACAVSISDLAAMGATPRGMMIAVGLPPQTPFGDLKDLALGFRRAADRLGFDVWGGDLKQAPTEHITTTALGEVARGRALTRRGARAGWTLAVTGFVGRAAMGGQLAARGEAEGFEMLYGFQPRVREAKAVARLAPSAACIDTSDGLSAALDQLARATPGVGFVVDAAQLPVQPGLRKAMGVDRSLEVVLHWGGDFELLLALPAPALEPARTALARMGCPLTAIGRVTRGGGLRLLGPQGERELPVRGFEHFLSSAGAPV
jgi:thiamine-monophosphate kinase